MRCQDQNSSGTTLALALPPVSERPSLGLTHLTQLRYSLTKILLDLSAPPTMYAPAPHYITCKYAIMQVHLPARPHTALQCTIMQKCANLFSLPPQAPIDRADSSQLNPLTQCACLAYLRTLVIAL